MKTFFVQASWPRPAKTRESQLVAWGYAAVLLLFAVTQLFSFDELFPLFANAGLAGGYAISVAVVLCEVFALPFLLGMKLSPAMRVVSMVAGWCVPVLWLVVAVWQLAADAPLATIGLLGTVVPVWGGMWVVFVLLALGVAAAWASWGLWPFRTRKA